jgi:hypothetical protein
MVQLDCEYTLRIKLVEAGSEHVDVGRPPEEPSSTTTNGSPAPPSPSSSPPDHLLLLCRALLLHAQETYHRHSLHQEHKQRIKENRNSIGGSNGAAAAKMDVSMMHNKKDGTTAAVHLRHIETASPCILQSCVRLGCKMLLERRIRKTLVKVREWLSQQLQQQQQHQQDGNDQSNNNNGDDLSSASAWNRLQVHWLSLSILDQHAQFTVSFRSWHIDVHLAGDRLTVTQFVTGGGIGGTYANSSSGEENGNSTTAALGAAAAAAAASYRKVDFYSDCEFELFLRNSLWRQL